MVGAHSDQPESSPQQHMLHRAMPPISWKAPTNGGAFSQKPGYIPSCCRSCRCHGSGCSERWSDHAEYEGRPTGDHGHGDHPFHGRGQRCRFKSRCHLGVRDTAQFFLVSSAGVKKCTVAKASRLRLCSSACCDAEAQSTPSWNAAQQRMQVPSVLRIPCF